MQIMMHLYSHSSDKLLADWDQNHIKFMQPKTAQLTLILIYLLVIAEKTDHYWLNSNKLILLQYSNYLNHKHLLVFKNFL